MSDSLLHLAPEPARGVKLGRYEVLCRLSTGGMSEIFLAYQRGVAGFRKLVVLKQILPNIKDDENFVRMFLNEAKLAAAFSHPSIAQVYDLDIDGQALFLAMEFVPGATLVEVARACREKGERIPVGFTLTTIRDTALALHYAHTYVTPVGNLQPVIHRDVAEKNIMVTYDGATKLLDFGVAKSVRHTGRTAVGVLKGSAGYMSPEQLRGEALDARSDVFSLGVVLHELLTGVRLFHAEKLEDELMAPMRLQPIAPSRKHPDVTPALDRVTFHALEKDRERRPQTALELARELEEGAGALMWKADQMGAFMNTLFSKRREQTRRLFQASEYQEATGEHFLQEMLADLSPPGAPRASSSSDSPGRRPTRTAPAVNAENLQVDREGGGFRSTAIIAPEDESLTRLDRPMQPSTSYEILDDAHDDATRLVEDGTVLNDFRQEESGRSDRSEPPVPRNHAPTQQLILGRPRDFVPEHDDLSTGPVELTGSGGSTAESVRPSFDDGGATRITRNRSGEVALKPKRKRSFFTLLFVVSVGAGAGVMLMPEARSVLSKVIPELIPALSGLLDSKPSTPPSAPSAQAPDAAPVVAPSAEPTTAEVSSAPGLDGSVESPAEAVASGAPASPSSELAPPPTPLVPEESTGAPNPRRAERTGPAASDTGARLLEAGARGGQRGFPPGRLTLKTTPSSVRVYLGQRLLGTTPLKALSLPPGTHTLRLEAGNREPRRLLVRIPSGGRTNMDVRVRSLPRL